MRENANYSYSTDKSREGNFDESKNKDGCCNGKNIFVAILKGSGCFLLGVVLTALHYAFDLIAAPLGTILRTIVGCVNLYSKTNPEGFFQHVWYIFKSLFLVIYNLIKLPFLVVYRATFGLIEDAVGIIKPMCCVFRGDKIADKVQYRDPLFSNGFKSTGLTDSNLVVFVAFALACIEFESPLFNDPSKHGKFKKFFTGIWDKVHGKFGEFAKWLLLPKKINKNTLNTEIDDNYNTNNGNYMSQPKVGGDEFDIFDKILHPLLGES